jgi:hypothetical protein
MLRRGEIPRANAELYLVTVTPHESIALCWLPPRRSSAQRHECSSKRLVRHSYVALCGKTRHLPSLCGRTGGGMGKPAPGSCARTGPALVSRYAEFAANRGDDTLSLRRAENWVNPRCCCFTQVATCTRCKEPGLTQVSDKWTRSKARMRSTPWPTIRPPHHQQPIPAIPSGSSASSWPSFPARPRSGWS